jgi:RimJ/RimL family protein N-acetyltransferase
MSSPNLPYEFADPLRTERLLVRAMVAGDVDDLHAYHSREDVCRYLPYEPRTRDEVAEKVARNAAELTLAADGDYWQLAVERLDMPGRVIGDVFFALRSTDSAGGEIGWVQNPDHFGHGYMTEAAGAVLELAFTAIGLHRVMAQLSPLNTASIALCKRLGMREEAHFRENEMFKGGWGDTLIFAILRTEWESR